MKSLQTTHRGPEDKPHDRVLRDKPRQTYVCGGISVNRSEILKKHKGSFY
jgi:hypothetical protein